MSNKFIGIYKTESEYDWRDCLILSYGIPLNSEFTRFDYENTLIVDLRSVSQSIGDYLRELTLSTEVSKYKTFMEFAATRKFQGKEIDVLNQLNTMDAIKKVPAVSVKIKFNDEVRGEYSMTVEEINAMISAAISDSENAQAETLPLTERVVREEYVHGSNKGNNSKSVNEVLEQVVRDESKPSEVSELRSEIQELRDVVTALSNAVTALTTPKKRGRPPKAKTKTE